MISPLRFAGLLLAMFAQASSCNAPAQARDYWVDYEDGDDNDTSTSRASAWKHAPGDPAATGAAAQVVLVPGDRVIFASGVRYRGALTIETHGTAEKPIVLMGENGDGSAIIDGSDQVQSITQCQSQASCGGAAEWMNLHIIGLAEKVGPGATLFGTSGALTEAQWPDPADSFYADATKGLAEVAADVVMQGRVPVPPEVAGPLKFGDPVRVALWIRSNRIEELPAILVADDHVRFEPDIRKVYSDRASRFALRGHPSLISQVGEYAILPGGKAIVAWLDEKSVKVTLATGRRGIDLAKSAHVRIEGLSFENMADVPGDVRSGIPIAVQRAPAENLVIVNNRFANLKLNNGQGAVTMQRVTGLSVQGNSFDTIAFGSGMRISNSLHIQVRENSISRIGRTGIMLMGNQDALIAANQIRDVLGVHGNGISVYLGNRDIRVVANTVVDAYQPATFHGNRDKQPDARNIVFERNLFVAAPDALGALISWGANTNDVTIFGNVLMGSAKGALRLSNKDNVVTVRGNVIDGVVFGQAYPSGWTVADNTFTRLGTVQMRYQPDDTINSSLASKRFESGAEKMQLGAFCPFLMISEKGDNATDPYARSIGSEFRCP